MLKIFIGWDSRFPEPADVLRESLLEHASIPLDIRFLKLHELDLNRIPDPRSSTEFTYSRFLVPHLCEFKGKAIFMDSDMLCFADIKELDDLDMEDLALRVVKHDHKPTNIVKMYGCEQSTYPRKNWSSLMIMNCAKLSIWRKDIVATESGAFLHRFQGIPDPEIGDIPKGWNSLDTKDETTKMIHYTNGGPWLEAYRNHPHAGVWFSARDATLHSNASRHST
jgi:lipopolysaccharide biosynthesis glycosyltransferase